MILVKASPEFITDIFTPSVCGIHECVAGLPEGATLVNVTQDGPTGIVTFVFEDGKTEQTTVKLKYTRPVIA